MLFARRVQRNTPGTFSTRVFTTGTEVRIDFFYKHCRVKLYLKEGRALRIETVINDADDLDILKGLAHLPQVQRAARQIMLACLPCCVSVRAVPLRTHSLNPSPAPPQGTPTDPDLSPSATY